jgi:obg-like ATPase 1
MSKEEAANYLVQNNMTSQLPNIILAGYKALDLIHYFTCGQQEVRAWTVRVSVVKYRYMDVSLKKYLY